jgi:hypothetical protein
MNGEEVTGSGRGGGGGWTIRDDQDTRQRDLLPQGGKVHWETGKGC